VTPTCFLIALSLQQSSANTKKSKDDTTGGSEWTEEEKSSLSDALKLYDLVQYVCFILLKWLALSLLESDLVHVTWFSLSESD